MAKLTVDWPPEFDAVIYTAKIIIGYATPIKFASCTYHIVSGSAWNHRDRAGEAINGTGCIIKLTGPVNVNAVWESRCHSERRDNAGTSIDDGSKKLVHSN